MRKILGTLLPLNSLVSKQFGNDYFSSAERFVDWLYASGQNVWQMLPLHATSWRETQAYFTSPYSSYGVGLNPFILTSQERKQSYPKLSKKFEEKNAYWLDDYAVFIAISRKFKTDNWLEWEAGLRNRYKLTVVKIAKELEPEIQQIKSEQAYLHNKFQQLRDYADSGGIDFWGDLPFYLPLSSPLVWSNQEAFHVGQKGDFGSVSGVPAEKHFPRQLWGHPLYRWEGGKIVEILNTWFIRLKYLRQLYSTVRLDHAIGFYYYGKLDPKDSLKDVVDSGPGDGAMEKIIDYCAQIRLNLIMEDITSFDLTDLHRIMDRFELPGMSVLTMSMTKYSSGVEKRYFDASKFGKNHIFYSSSHDVSPLVAFLKKLPDSKLKILADSLNVSLSGSVEKMAMEMRETLVRRSGNLIIPLQDWILSEERINRPGTVSPKNWNYKMSVPVEELPKEIF